MTVGQLIVDYDDRADVLYVALNAPRAAECEDGPQGLLWRYDVETDQPCGVTVLGMALWQNQEHRLAEEIGNFLDLNPQEVERAIRAGVSRC